MLIMLIIPACGPESDSLSTRSRDLGTGSRGTGSTAAADDWGTDWDPGRNTGSADTTAGSSTVWAIVLATFPSESGSLGYDSVENPDAQAALHRIKAIEIQGQPAFARAMLTRVKVRPVGIATHPLSLMSVRLRYPNLDPLYTLEVGIWGDFESGELTLKQIHEKAERQTRELRNRGFEAYFYHDNDKRLSVVSVGVFDRTAIDARSGMYGPGLQTLMDQFPAHLVNGETLLEPIDGRDASRGTRVQKPMPVLIPKR